MSKSALKPLESLVGEIKTLIEQSRQQVAVTVNATMTMLYWQIGRRINQEVLKEQRAEYGRQIVVSLAQQLETEYGRGWSEKQLRHCLRTAETIELDAYQDTKKRVTDLFYQQFQIANKRYGITDEEIAFIESKIRPMEVKSE